MLHSLHYTLYKYSDFVKWYLFPGNKNSTFDITNIVKIPEPQKFDNLHVLTNYSLHKNSNFKPTDK